jgi:hypothetical protein
MFFYLQSVPLKSQASRLFEFNYNQTNIPSKINETDQAVTLLRSNNLAAQLNINSQISIYKPGPLSLVIQTESPHYSSAQNSLNKLADYLVTNFDVKEVGVETTKLIYPNYLLYYLSAFSLGVLLSLIISLVREYFAKY